MVNYTSSSINLGIEQGLMEFIYNPTIKHAF